MIAVAQVVAGLVLGMIAGLLHLAVLRWRVRRALTRGVGQAMLLYPVGLSLFALPIVAAAQVAPLSAWVSIAGVLIVRWRVLR